MGDWKAVQLGGHLDAEAPVELYDLSTDRGETTDVSADHPEIIERVWEVFDDRTPSEIPRWAFPIEENGN